MKEIKKYTSIERYGKRGTTDCMREGVMISVTEKLDGANASFTLDNENSTGVSAYSRSTVVTDDNTLRGYNNWVKEVIVPIKDKLVPNYRYYGEWLVSHTVKYKEDAYYKFYLFSIWDEESQEYLSDDIVKAEAKRLNLLQPEYFYEGEFISYEHLQQFVGKSNLTKEPDTGEGIVVKNTSYKDKQGSQLFLKIVTEKFKEIQKQRPPKDPNLVTEFTLVVDKLRTVLNNARIEKMLNKLVDENVIPEDYGIEDMGIILKSISGRLMDDIAKEEPEVLEGLEKRLVNKGSSTIIAQGVKSILANKGDL